MSRRSRQSRRGLIRKGVIQTNSSPNASCCLESSFDLFFTNVQADIRQELPQDAADGEVTKKAVILWRHLSPRDRAHWNKLADHKNQRVLAERRIVSHCEPVEELTPAMTKESSHYHSEIGDDIECRSLFCIEEDDESEEEDHNIYRVSTYLDKSLEETDSMKSSTSTTTTTSIISPNSPDRDQDRDRPLSHSHSHSHSLGLSESGEMKMDRDKKSTNNFIRLSLVGLSGSGSL